MVLLTYDFPIPSAGPPFVSCPGSVLEEASSKEKRSEPHRSPDVTESCWQITARANVRDIFLSQIKPDLIVLLKSLQVKKILILGMLVYLTRISFQIKISPCDAFK